MAFDPHSPETQRQVRRLKAELSTRTVASLKKALAVGYKDINRTERQIAALQEARDLFIYTATCIEDEIASRKDGNVYKFVPKEDKE